jgi:hypothetical protein
LRETDTDLRTSFRVEYIPAFSLSALQSACTGLLVVRMNLDRQLFTREDIFDEQRKLVSRRVLEPDFADPAAVSGTERAWKLGTAPRLFHLKTAKFETSFTNTREFHREP